MGKRSPNSKPGRVVLACVVALLPLTAVAQDRDELVNLVFDPVPIAIASDAGGAAQVHELGALPRGEALSPGEWFARNGMVPPSRQLSPAESVTRLELLVRELEINEGTFSPNLPQQLQALGSALQEAGELEQAQEYFQQAMHITRVHHGLFSEAQFPYIRHSIDNHLLQGNLFAADEQQRYLFYLKQKNLADDSTALLDALEDFAAWNIFAFNAPAMIPTLAFDGSAPVDEAMFRVERLLNAQHIYWSIAQLLVQNFGRQDPRLPEAEQRLAFTNYLFATNVAANPEALNLGAAAVPVSASTTGLNPGPSLGNLGYRQGREALERRRDYLAGLDAAVEDQLLAHLDVADWMLYFGRQRMKALELYADIRADFAGRLPAERLQALLAPPHPQPLPSFVKPSWSRAALGLPEDLALAYKGHIDVEFELNRFGRTAAVKVLGASNPEARLVEQRLLRSLRRTQFRPRFDGEQPRLGDTLQMRYYYSW